MYTAEGTLEYEIAICFCCKLCNETGLGMIGCSDAVAVVVYDVQLLFCCNWLVVAVAGGVIC